MQPKSRVFFSFSRVPPSSRLPRFICLANGILYLSDLMLNLAFNLLDGTLDLVRFRASKFTLGDLHTTLNLFDLSLNSILIHYDVLLQNLTPLGALDLEEQTRI